MKYDEIPTNLLVANLATVINFTCQTAFTQSNLRNMYKTLLENKVLIKEIKRILEMFPESVIITPMRQNQKNALFTNRQFNEAICKLDQNLEKLEQIKVKFDPKDGASEEISLSLRQLLKECEKR